MRRRVVITGVGAATPFGVGADAFWNALCEGSTALAPIRSFDARNFAASVAGEIADLKVRDLVPRNYRKAVKVMARDIEIAVAAADDAVTSARLTTKASSADNGHHPTYEPHRLGCQIGAGLIATDLNELARALKSASAEGAFSYREWGDGAMNNLTPLWMLKYLPNMLACHVTIIHDARGPSNTITCGSASGPLCIGESMRVIERGDADAAFAGGAESKVNPIWLFRLGLTGELANAHADADPASIVKPFDPVAGGTAVAEAGGVAILEALETARARNAEPLAEIRGFGAGHAPRSDDPEERADGLRIAIEAAIKDAGCSTDDIDAIAANAVGVPLHDATEAAALERVFADRLPDIELITLAPALGNAYAGHGALAAVAAARAIADQRLPARVHAGSPNPRIRAESTPARDAELRRVLVVSSAAMGQNAALVLAHPDTP